MKKILFLSVLSGLLMTANADESKYQAFQNFDNQVGFGLGFQQGNFSHMNRNNNNAFQTSTLNLEVEKLLDMGLWADINIGNVQSYVEPNTPLGPLGSYPYLITLNGKLGYNFPLLKNELSVTPYALLGKNANTTQFNTVMGGLTTGTVITQDFYYTTGIGARIEFLVNKQIMIYFDQMVGYNFDQGGVSVSSAVNGSPQIIQTSNWQTTSTLGTKFNPWQNLQLGANVFYSTYAGYDAGSVDYLQTNNNLGGVPVTQMGVLMSAGFTFK